MASGESRPPVPLRRRHVALAFALSLLALAPFVQTGLAFRDSGEFVLTAASAGIPHPPGAPTYAILSALFVRALWFLPPVLATNLFSAVCAAAAMALLFRIVCRALGRFTLLAGLAPAWLLLSPSFREIATTAEQYALLLALLLAFQSVLVEREPRGWHPVALGALAGLSIGNHPSQVVLLAVLPLWWWWRARNARAAAFAALGLGLGLLVFLYVPLRSRAEPLLDWGDVETWDRFLWSIGREQWRTRPLAEVPAGFLSAWLKSYGSFAETGFAAVALAAIAASRAALARSRELLLFALPTALYAAVIFGGHLRQQGMDVPYVRFYGVRDWHVPLYALVAVGLPIGLLRYHRVLAILVALLVVESIFRGWTALRDTGQRYDHAAWCRAILERLPEDAVLVTSSDETAFGLAAHLLVRERAATPAILWGWPSLSSFLANGERSGLGWGAAARAAYREAVLTDPFRNQLRVPIPTAERWATAPIVTEFTAYDSEAARYAVPRGFLIELRNEPTTDEDIARADAHFRPLSLPDADRTAPLAERMAWAELWQRRADFFATRGMWLLAAREYRRAVSWVPEHAPRQLMLGEALLRSNDPAGAETALRRAIAEDPHLPLAHFFYGMMKAQGGALLEARELFREELRINPSHRQAKDYLEQVERDLAAR